MVEVLECEGGSHGIGLHPHPAVLLIFERDYIIRGHQYWGARWVRWGCNAMAGAAAAWRGVVIWVGSDEGRHQLHQRGRGYFPVLLEGYIQRLHRRHGVWIWAPSGGTPSIGFGRNPQLNQTHPYYHSK